MVLPVAIGIATGAVVVAGVVSLDEGGSGFRSAPSRSIIVAFLRVIRSRRSITESKL